MAYRLPPSGELAETETGRVGCVLWVSMYFGLCGREVRVDPDGTP